MQEDRMEGLEEVYTAAQENEIRRVIKEEIFQNLKINVNFDYDYCGDGKWCHVELHYGDEYISGDSYYINDN